MQTVTDRDAVNFAGYNQVMLTELAVALGAPRLRADRLAASARNEFGERTMNPDTAHDLVEWMQSQIS